MKKNVNLQALRDANKECNTLSGACKIVAAFWSAGYKTAFEQFGLTFASMKDVPSIISIAQKDEEGNIYLTKQVRVLDENKQPILNEDGRTYKKERANVPVKVWTPNTLYKVLEQSTNK